MRSKRLLDRLAWWILKRRRPVRGATIDIEYSISFEESYSKAQQVDMGHDVTKAMIDGLEAHGFDIVDVRVGGPDE